jgi:hypothetical protein
MEITPQEIISTVQTFSVSVQEEIVETLQKNLEKTISSAPNEDAIEQILLAKGLISEIPPRSTDNEEETFAPVEVDGKPLSETILEERE